MAATNETDETRLEEPQATLGGLLYGGDAADTCVREDEWVRLVRAVADRDQQALRALYERMHRIVFTLAMRILNDRETAEEVMLDVFHDVWRRAAGYDPANGTVVGWISNQARSRAIDRFRFQRRKKRVAPEAPAPQADAQRPPDDVERQESGRALRAALATLAPAEREAIEVAYFAGLTHTEVAAKLDQPLGTIKTRIRSGLGKLRRALADTGADE